MASIQGRSFRRLLVANRGEIAARIISTARELDLEVFAVYTSGDNSHTRRAAHAIQLDSPSAYLDVSSLVEVVNKHKIEAVHPGYGFLSESAEFAKEVAEVGAIVVGPGWEILERTGDKLKARKLAEECGVPVAPALLTPTNNVHDITKFADKVGYPIMIKAVDGGGGRGIRLIREAASLESSARRAVKESPSRQVFAEKAAIDGFRHIEVQIVGDGRGNVGHLWERECSIQRRYQKVVEQAPSSISDRQLVNKVISCAIRMAQKVKYLSLGTFEFLLNPSTKEFYFLEVNPRLQVEHTITESIAQLDLVRIQLLLAQGHDLRSTGFPSKTDPKTAGVPQAYSLQLRITAENVQSNWSLSIGRITSFRFPTGNGIRVDTHILNGYETFVSADFDSLMAKIIVTASTWEEVVRKASRALEDTQIAGIKTNIEMLRAIVAHPDFAAGRCDTQWLEKNQPYLIQNAFKITASKPGLDIPILPTSSVQTATSNASVLFRKGDAFSINLRPGPGTSSSSKSEAQTHHLEISRVLQNAFPDALTAEVLYSTPSGQQQFRLDVASTTTSAASATSTHKRGDNSNPAHIVIPFAGKLMEVVVDEGDAVKEGDTICVIRQMKMELEVRSPRSGVIQELIEADEGEDLAEGTLAAVLDLQAGPKL